MNPNETESTSFMVMFEPICGKGNPSGEALPEKAVEFRLQDGSVIYSKQYSAPTVPSFVGFFHPETGAQILPASGYELCGSVDYSSDRDGASVRASVGRVCQFNCNLSEGRYATEIGIGLAVAVVGLSVLGILRDRVK